MTFLVSCRTESYDPQYAELRIKLNYVCGNHPLIYDSLMYTNASSEVYQVEHLEYYLSDIKLFGTDGSVHHDRTIHYINAGTSSDLRIRLDSIAPGKYNRMTCYIGIDSSRNRTGYLPNTLENAAMAWPEFMGGGYHFMKLEGRFQDTTLWGFAVHLGTNDALTQCEIPVDLNLRYVNHTATMTMDINEWFQNPFSYSFINDGNYTMGNQLLMGIVRDNGADVLTFTQNN